MRINNMNTALVELTFKRPDAAFKEAFVNENALKDIAQRVRHQLSTNVFGQVAFVIHTDDHPDSMDVSNVVNRICNHAGIKLPVMIVGSSNGTVTDEQSERATVKITSYPTTVISADPAPTPPRKRKKHLKRRFNKRMVA